MIRIENVSKWYGDFQVLKNCSTSVKKGEVVVICGPSGSGKSTLIKTVNGLEDFQEGTIYVNNINIGDPHTNLPKLRAHVGMVFQHFELFPHLTIRDNLTLAQMKVLKRSRDQANAPQTDASQTDASQTESQTGGETDQSTEPNTGDTEQTTEPNTDATEVTPQETEVPMIIDITVVVNQQIDESLRPEKVKVTLNDTVLNVSKETVELTKENNWTYKYLIQE